MGNASSSSASRSGDSAVGQTCRPNVDGGPHLQCAHQTALNSTLDRASNNKTLELARSLGPRSFEQKPDVIQSHKDDYQHWTHFVCSQADGVTADVPKVQYRLEEPLPGRQHASAPARTSPKSSCCPQHTPERPSSGPEAAPACPSLTASAVSEQTAARLSSSHAVAMRSKLHTAEMLRVANMTHASRSGSSRVEDRVACEASFRQQVEAAQSTPPKRVEHDEGDPDGHPSMSLTLAASTPSTTWRTPAAGLDAAQSSVEFDGLASCVQDLTPVLIARTTAQTLPHSRQKVQKQQRCPEPHSLTADCVASPMAAVPVIAQHTARTATLPADADLAGNMRHGESSELAAVSGIHAGVACVSAQQDVRAPGTPTVQAQASSQTSSLYSDGIDELLATISTPESVKKRVNDQNCQASGVAPAASGGTAGPCTSTAGFKPGKGMAETLPAGHASAVVPAGRLDAQEAAVVRRLLQWGKGGLASSLTGERAMLLHKVVEVLRPEPGELRLLMFHVSSETHRWAHLYGGWADTDVSVGDTANLIVEQDQWVPAEDGVVHCVLDNGRGGLFVLHPDMLISGTSITSALRCPRQAMLQEKGVGSPSRAACLGTLMHELAQTALLALTNEEIGQQQGSCDGAKLHRPPPFPRRDRLAASVWNFMMDFIPKLVADNVMQLTEVGLTQREAEHELRQASGQLARTLASHFRQSSVQMVHGASSGPKASIEGVLDIEESIWAPRFGLKGVIDATIISRALQQGAEANPKDSEGKYGVAALEFKSGKVYSDHAAQLGIYGLLLHARYGTRPVKGLLWYSRVEDMDPVSLEAHDVAGLMMTRNRLAAHKARGAWALPPPLQSLHSCRSCMVLPLCAVAHHAMEGGNKDSFGLPEQYTKLTEHLTERGSEFFRHWLHLLETEQAADRIPQSNIWAVNPPPHVAILPRGVKRPRPSSMEAHEGDVSENISPNSQPTSQKGEHQQLSEQKPPRIMLGDDVELQLSQEEEVQHPLVGRCIGSLVKLTFDGECSDLALYPFVYTFTQKRMSTEATLAEAVHELLPMNAQGFAAGDCGILSVQDRHVAVNRARVLSVSSTDLKLALRSRLPAALDALSGARACGQGSDCCSPADDLVWRLDKDEPETAFQCAVSGLLELMVTQSAHAQRMRGLIVHHDAPHHSAKANYSNEVPAEEDCFQAMVEFERQQTLAQAYGTGTRETHAHVVPTSARQNLVMPMAFSHRQQDWQRSMSAPAVSQQQYQCGYPVLQGHPQSAVPARAAQQQQLGSTATVHCVPGHFGMAHAVHRPPLPASHCAQNRSSAPVHFGSGRLPQAAHQGQGWGAHNSMQAAPAACLATQSCHIQPHWTHGTGPAAPGCTSVFQQPFHQNSGRGVGQQCGGVHTSQRCLSAPTVQGIPDTQAVCRHPGMPSAPSQPVGTLPVKSNGNAAACSSMQHACSIRSSHVQNAPAQISTAPGTSSPALTAEQQEVVDRALAWDDYVLVMGLPGAGKTYTIAACVQALVAQGRSVLLSAYTNAALDNMLRRVLQTGETRVLRIGRTDAVHPEVAPYVLHVPSTGTKAAALEIRKHVRDVPVVGVTCLSAARAPLLRSRLFDVCILDEATQVTLPASLTPIMRSRTFVLVGDHLQLPPLVKSTKAQEGGLGESLFKILSDKHPQAVVTLKAQHRMCAPIMTLSNELTYDSRLRAATDAVAAARLSLPLMNKVLCNAPQWLKHVMARDPAVLWLDTRGVPAAADRRRCSSFCNPAEVSVTKQIVRVLLRFGADAADIGVTSPYNQQVRMLQNAVGLLSSSGCLSQLRQDVALPDSTGKRITLKSPLEAARKVAVMTIDKFQGQDKASMVISMVRSNLQGHTGTLLSDCRRINVALTRAKHKLVIIGNSDTLCKVSMLKQAFEAIQRLGMTIDLTESDIGL